MKGNTFFKYILVFLLASFNAVRAATPNALTLIGANITIESGVTVTVKGSVFIDDDGAGTDGTIWDAGTLTVTEDWTNNNANGQTGITSSSGTVELIGNTPQTIGGTLTTKFWALTINNSYGTIPQIILGVETGARNNLTMTQGVVDMQNYNFRHGTRVTPAILSHTSGWFYSSHVTPGYFVRGYSGGIFALLNQKGFFPVGSSVDYRPFWMATTAGSLSTLIGVRHIPTYPAWYTVTSHTDATWGGGTVVQGISNSYWDVSEIGPTVIVGVETFDIRYGGNGFGTFVLTDLNATRAANSPGTFAAATAVGVPLEVNRTGLIEANINADLWYIGTRDVVNSPLPIELLSFTAVLNANKKVDLNWSTATETNNDFFTVEKTKDGDTFEQVAIVDGAGNSSVTLYYTSLDPNPYQGKSYYRLKQTDFNGEYKYSHLVEVDMEGNIHIAENVFNNQDVKIQINTKEVNEPFQLTLFSSTGQRVYGQLINPQGNIVSVDLSQKLAPGVYLISMEMKNTGKYLADKIIITN